MGGLEECGGSHGWARGVLDWMKVGGGGGGGGGGAIVVCIIFFMCLCRHRRRCRGGSSEKSISPCNPGNCCHCKDVACGRPVLVSFEWPPFVSIAFFPLLLSVFCPSSDLSGA